jgi:general secretion pathway protein K
VLELDPGLVDAIIDWIDPDGVAGSTGAEDAVYATLDPPRRAANAPFAHVSELRAVSGVTADGYEKLAPHVCARPRDAGDTPLNVNTASPAVLMSLHDGIGSAVARRLYNDGRARYASTNDFRAALDGENLIPPLGDHEIGVSSRYFVAEAEMILGEVPIRLYSLLERDEGQRIRVIARSQGQF